MIKDTIINSPKPITNHSINGRACERIRSKNGKIQPGIEFNASNPDRPLAEGHISS
jgi:hypothetical protein